MLMVGIARSSHRLQTMVRVPSPACTLSFFIYRTTYSKMVAAPRTQSWISIPLVDIWQQLHE
jgi:hypothetical protein